MQGAGPLGDDLAGEQTIASYRGDQVRLTDRRVVYRGIGVRRREFLSMHLADITAVGIRRAGGFNPRLLFVPLALFSSFFLMAMFVNDEGPMVVGMILAALTLPMAAFNLGLTIRIAAPGETLSLRIPRRHLADAQSFVRRLEAVRAEGVKAAAATDVTRPTSRPFALGNQPDPHAYSAPPAPAH